VDPNIGQEGNNKQEEGEGENVFPQSSLRIQNNGPECNENVKEELEMTDINK
jgi:hypothetical protein